jgi:acyl-CoA synthetase (NDP forming)
VQSAGIAHKTEAGGVRIGVPDAAAVEAAFDAIVASAKAYAPEAVIDGVSVQEMVSGGTELIVGVQNDPLFGPAVMVGLGGIYAEVFKDVSFRLAPLTRSVAESMLHDLKCFPLLDGARGRPKADVDAVVDVLLKLSALSIDLKQELAELDINPLVVLEQGRGVRALDALAKPHVAS